MKNGDKATWTADCSPNGCEQEGERPIVIVKDGDEPPPGTGG